MLFRNSILRFWFVAEFHFFGSSNSQHSWTSLLPSWSWWRLYKEVHLSGEGISCLAPKSFSRKNRAAWGMTRGGSPGWWALWGWLLVSDEEAWCMGNRLNPTFEASGERFFSKSGCYWETDLGSTGKIEFEAWKQFNNRMNSDERVDFSSPQLYPVDWE